MVAVIDDSALVARIYVPEFAMHDIHLGAPGPPEDAGLPSADHGSSKFDFC